MSTAHALQDAPLLPSADSHLSGEDMLQLRSQLNDSMNAIEAAIIEITFNLIAREIAAKHPDVTRVEFDALSDNDVFYGESWLVTRTDGQQFEYGDQDSDDDTDIISVIDITEGGLPDYAQAILMQRGRKRNGRNTIIDVTERSEQWTG